MKSFAENTMNELLGWYGYDKVELRDGESGEGVDHPQHVSVLKENSLTKVPVSMETSDASPDRVPDPRPAPASRNGVPEPSSTATASTSAPPGVKEHPGLPVMVPMVPPRTSSRPQTRTRPRCRSCAPGARRWACAATP
ncbi:sine oculis-binding protein homolog A-like [Gadus chalcogrammus]|uniref:sine oculis-binding protein homolog A-like n=1 Tax=Gadus chalcogrammus TaxID=1042646 RepID=UPI0024C3001E|nr:sine oculis-binding protein homolog A-like [Gadus chalcogrammus]